MKTANLEPPSTTLGHRKRKREKRKNTERKNRNKKQKVKTKNKTKTEKRQRKMKTSSGHQHPWEGKKTLTIFSPHLHLSQSSNVYLHSYFLCKKEPDSRLLPNLKDQNVLWCQGWNKNMPMRKF